MRYYRIYIIGVTLCLGLLLTLSGCSSGHDDAGDLPGQPGQPGQSGNPGNPGNPDHPGQPELPGTRELHLSLGSQPYRGTRAAGDLPTGFELYNHDQALAPITQIQTYFTYQDGENGPWKYVASAFTYQKTGENDTWTSTVALKDGQFYLYGFMPKDNMGSSVTITAPDGGTFADGAVLTFKDLNAVSPDDICIIVGAKGYSTSTKPDMSTRLGQFGYQTDDGDNLFLLVDHLFAGLKFNIRLGEDYSQLRGVKVRSIKLMPDNGGTDVLESVTATITVNSSGMNPPEFSDFKYGTKPNPALLFKGEKELTTTGVEFLGCLCPTTNTKFSLEFTYDVYDSKGNLIREGETARNAIKLQDDMVPGQIHTVNMTVLPTYIYMLSDPDLDNPSFVVE